MFIAIYLFLFIKVELDQMMKNAILVVYLLKIYISNKLNLYLVKSQVKNFMKTTMIRTSTAISSHLMHHYALLDSSDFLTTSKCLFASIVSSLALSTL